MLRAFGREGDRCGTAQTGPGIEAIEIKSYKLEHYNLEYYKLEHNKLECYKLETRNL